MGETQSIYGPLVASKPGWIQTGPDYYRKLRRDPLTRMGMMVAGAAVVPLTIAAIQVSPLFARAAITRIPKKPGLGAGPTVERGYIYTGKVLKYTVGPHTAYIETKYNSSQMYNIIVKGYDWHVEIDWQWRIMSQERDEGWLPIPVPVLRLKTSKPGSGEKPPKLQVLDPQKTLTDNGKKVIVKTLTKEFEKQVGKKLGTSKKSSSKRKNRCRSRYGSKRIQCTRQSGHTGGHRNGRTWWPGA